MFIYRKAFTSSILHHPTCSWKTRSFIFQGSKHQRILGTRNFASLHFPCTIFTNNVHIKLENLVIFKTSSPFQHNTHNASPPEVFWRPRSRLSRQNYLGETVRPIDWNKSGLSKTLQVLTSIQQLKFKFLRTNKQHVLH